MLGGHRFLSFDSSLKKKNVFNIVCSDKTLFYLRGQLTRVRMPSIVTDGLPTVIYVSESVYLKTKIFTPLFCYNFITYFSVPSSYSTYFTCLMYVGGGLERDTCEVLKLCTQASPYAATWGSHAPLGRSRYEYKYFVSLECLFSCVHLFTYTHIKYSVRELRKHNSDWKILIA